ncbi:MAG: cyoE [Candidatus Saccharibacteria bacterium]|nr:cyoE [Candidatus Saccharibacteria bacterium]
MAKKLSAYYQLTKPGVLYGNVLTAAAGFLLAARGEIDLWLFLATIVGMTLVIAAACVLNNYLDQDIDRIMTRTQSRPSVTGAVKGSHILAYAAVLVLIGMVVLALWTNWLVVAIAAAGFVTYVWLYGALSKRRSIHGTLVGSISGAMPIAAGYAAVSGQVDAGLVIVFMILFFWQFPEFYSIAIYRRKEYAAAHIPVMPVVKGVRSTTIQIFLYTILYVIATLSLTLLGYTGYVYFVVMAFIGGYWIWLGALGLRAKDPDAWARRMFRFSMITILVLCLMLSLGPILP